MAVDKCVVFLVVVAFLCTFNSGDAEYCVFGQSCILLCSFQPGDEVVIHWIQTEGNIAVHSYYHNQDQLERQDQRYGGRTSLFKNQISSGNASLRLTGVQVPDRGKYKCYTSTITGNKESFIDLHVEAPVHQVDIEHVENKITCSSEGIYPEPKLTWSFNHPSSLTLPNKTTVQKTKQQLYSISSSLLLDNTNDVVYSCTVSAGRNNRMATLLKPTSLSSSDTDMTIPCTSTNTPLTGLIWTFNHSQVIVKWNRTDEPYTVSEEWRQQVKAVTESGSLMLQEISPHLEGIYTCELRSDERTYVTNIFLKIEESHGVPVGGIIAAVVVVVILLAVVMIVVRRKCSDSII